MTVRSDIPPTNEDWLLWLFNSKNAGFGHTQEEIAKASGLTRRTVNKRITRVKNYLAELLRAAMEPRGSRDDEDVQDDVQDEDEA